MSVSLLSVVHLKSSNGPGISNSWIPHDSSRLEKHQKNRRNHNSMFENERCRLCVVSKSTADISISNEAEVKDMVLKQVNMLRDQMEQLNEAYSNCRHLCEQLSRTFYLGTLVMDAERQKAIWAIYAWCRRTDDLVDGPDASNITPTDLDMWEERLEDIFKGQPHDKLDMALSDTIAKFHIPIQPFRDMIQGMRMDLTTSRYKTFDELYRYCYHVDATVGLMTLPVIGIAPESKATTEYVSNCLLKLGLAIQMTNILRDVGEDARRGRVYLPQDELAEAGLSDNDILVGKVTDKWRDFMKKQIDRAKKLFDDAERAIPELSSASRWPMWATVLINRQMLDEIKANDYDNFTTSVTVSNTKKLLTLSLAFVKSLVVRSRIR